MINVTKPYLPDRKKFDSYIDKIYKSNWLTNFGPLHDELEEKLCEYLGVPNIVLMANGTLPLQVAMHLFDLQGEVITTPFSFVATTSAIVWEGRKPVFADIDPNTYCIYPKQIEPKITENTSAIIPVNVYGNVCDFKGIKDIAEKHGLKVLYDSSHCFAVKKNGESILNFGDASTLSFHATKLFHTGEGGALILKDSDLAREAKKLINFGYEKGQIGSIGINAKMNEFSAAMGLCVLDDIDNIIERRAEIYNLYHKELSQDLKFMSLTENIDFNFAYCPVLFESEEKLLKAKNKLEENGINPRRYFYPSLDTLNYTNENNCPISQNISKRVLCLPIFEDLGLENAGKICKLIK